MSDVTPDDLELAVRIVRDGVTKHHAALVALAGEPMGKLWTFSSSERAALDALRGTLDAWWRRPGPERPLCLAVFGPPGAGKSFAVNQLLATLQGPPVFRREFRAHVFNLTQFEHARELALALSKVSERRAKNELPVVFFDEFDAPRGARDLGWLPWFLAPMQDGEWILDGERHTLRRAIYVFAGGTANTFAAFTGDDVSELDARRAKRPDFVSRLRGTLDIQGVDTAPRALRRAPILRQQLEAWNATWLGTPGHVPKELDDALVRRILEASSFRHGARSIGAVLDLVRVGAAERVVTEAALPDGWREMAGVGRAGARGTTRSSIKPPRSAGA